MRVVGGRHRGRKLEAPEGQGTRPTADRAREALFNILAHREPSLNGAIVLDLFAGSGALGIEALSRGAAQAVFVERDPKALACLRTNLRSLGDDSRALVMASDATRLPPSSLSGADLAFLDPPYGKDLAPPCLLALAQGGWLARDALVIVEVAAREAFAPPPPFSLVEERVYGAARLCFLNLMTSEM